MSERRINLVIVVAIVALLAAGIVAFIVWWHQGSQLPPGQDSMDSIAPGLVGTVADRGRQAGIVRHPIDRSDCDKPPNVISIDGVRCIVGAAPLESPKPLILIAPTPKSAR